MIETIDTSLIDWSRAQFALTAIYHWLFVPLTLGLSIILGVMETIYVVKKGEFWKRTTIFWMKLFGINFAIGVATGLILEFEFGTNWSNYSWFVGDIFGAPLAIEGIMAFFMESTFVAIMFFGWKKVSSKVHLASTWLTCLGATLSAWWILVANAWMQYPVGMEFNVETVRNEMASFFDIAFSPMAVAKFLHTVISSWIVGAVFVIGVSCWYLLKERNIMFAKVSIVIASFLGFTSSLLTLFTGDMSGVQIAKIQPMKLAVAEGLYDGGNGADFTLVGNLKIPSLLSFLATHDFKGYVPGINNIINGGYEINGVRAISADEKIARGKKAIASLEKYKKAKLHDDIMTMKEAQSNIQDNIKYFGYGFIKNTNQLIPPIDLVFWSFRVMVYLGMFFILLFTVFLYLSLKDKIVNKRWIQWIAFLSIPLVYISSQAGWVVSEVGRQPWSIQDMLPVGASVSRLQTYSVQTTFYIFLVIFTILFLSEIGIMIKAVRKGPDI